MDLYGDLPPVGGEIAQGGWSRPKANFVPRTQQITQASANPLQSPKLQPTKVAVAPKTVAPLAFKPRQAAQPSPSSAMKSGIASAPVVVVETIHKQQPLESNRDLHDHMDTKHSIAEYIPNVPVDSVSFDVVDPYDPARPNDYVAWCEERLERRRLAKLEEENAKKLLELEQIRANKERDRAEAMEAGDMNKLTATMGVGRGRGRGGITNLPAWMTQGASPMVSTIVSQEKMDVDEPSRYDDANDRGETESKTGAQVASKMMSRMGYVDGEGLGRDGQGITRPIEHRKVGTNHGQIVVDENDRRRMESRGGGGDGRGSHDAPSSGAPRRPQVLFTNPSCCVLLKNMVGPDEVDETLAEETKAECQKFGPVAECVVHEVRSRGCPPDECVRTFVLFEKQESAVRAYRDMNGRFFGGRKIVAAFFDEGKFARRDLEPLPNEY